MKELIITVLSSGILATFISWLLPTLVLKKQTKIE